MCFRLGHVAISCRFPPRFPSLSKDRIFSSHLRTNIWDPALLPTWFRQNLSQTGGDAPPKVFTPASSASIPWRLPEEPSFSVSSTQFPSESSDNLVIPDLELNLGIPNPHSAPLPPPPPLPLPLSRSYEFPPGGESPLQENPVDEATVFLSPADGANRMAYQFVDPTPFIQRGFQRVMVPNRRPMSRVILGRPARRNPNVAIVTIHPTP